MEPELVTLGTVSSGLISSSLSYQLGNIPEDNDIAVSAGKDELYVSLCASGTLLAIVTSSCLSQFSSHEDDERPGRSLTYSNSFQGFLDVPNDLQMTTKARATSLTVLPIAFNRNEKLQRASIVLVGFADGFVRGFSKSGQNVFSKLLHADTVTKFTFMCPSFSRRNNSPSTLAVLCGSVVCIVEGWSLVHVIQSNVEKMNNGSGWSEHDDDCPQLIFKKWELKEQGISNDIAFLGHSISSTYDYLCEASMVSGFESVIRSAPAPEAKLISVGQHPMVALYKINKDAGQVNMSKVMQAVASKTIGAVLGRISRAGGWLGWGSQQQEPQLRQSGSRKSDEKLYTPTDLFKDCNLPDALRTVLSITISPLGDLAALVDGFGRVLLLECDTFTVRRIWKGYRDAQCGWQVSEDNSTERTLSRAEKEGNKDHLIAQYLCIYAARRGILEVWPTQCGKRLIAFQIGKGCQILYSSCEMFSYTGVSSSDANPSWEMPIFKKSMTILSPLGDLISFSVPSSLEDPVAFDQVVMKNLLQCIGSGNTGEIVQCLSNIKSTYFLKLAIDSLLKMTPSRLPLEFVLQMVGVAIRKLQMTKAESEALHHYLIGCQQILGLKQTLDNLRSEVASPSNLPFNKFLNEKFDIPQDLACDLEVMLEKYYKAYTSGLPTLQDTTTIYELVQYFKLPSDVGNYPLHSSPDTECGRDIFSKRIPLQLKEENERSLLHLGCAIFMPLLSRQLSQNRITTVLKKSWISKKDLMVLFARVFLSGIHAENHLALLHQQLYEYTQVILKLDDTTDIQDSIWMPVCRQCAITSDVGQAFSLVLIYQRVNSASATVVLADEEERDLEEWETVSAEKGYWATLYTNLLVLVHLSNVVGQASLRALPSVPFYDIPDAPTSKDLTADLVDLKFKLFDKVYRDGCMSAAALKNGGPPLVTQCVCDWIVRRKKLRPEFIKKISIASGIGDKLYPELLPLLRLLPSSLKQVRLLLHCAWQAAYIGDDYYTGLRFISQLSEPQILSGIIGLLWCIKFEKIVVKSIEDYKKNIPLSREAMELISICRILFGYLHQLSLMEDESECEPQATDSCDDAVIFQMQNRKDLMGLVRIFPTLNPTIVCTCYELLLLCEISLHLQDKYTNLISFFPNWLRNSLKRSLFKSAWQEQVPLQLQQKRFKFLKEAVSICVEREAQPMMMASPIGQVTLTPMNKLCVEVTEYQDFVFLLGQLWKVNMDQLKAHWVCNLYAIGSSDQGKKIFLEIMDKLEVLNDLLSVVGHMTDLLIQQIKEKTTKLTLLAQTPPTLLEWMRKQGSTSVVKKCINMKPLWVSVSRILTLIIPYLSQTLKDRAMQLEKLIKIIK